MMWLTKYITKGKDMVKQFKLENGTGVEIPFSDDRHFMRVNEIAEKFNKNLNDWMRDHRAKEYMDSLLEDLSARSENSHNTFTTRLDLFMIKQRGRSKGTWIHPELVGEFASWVHPRFALWCDQTIRHITKDTPSVIATPQTSPKALRAHSDEIDVRDDAVVQESERNGHEEIVEAEVVTTEVAVIEPVDETIVMTLKDIVDIINKQEIEKGKTDSRGAPNTRHADAMKKIDKLSQSPEFGATRKTRVVYNDHGQTMETYAFTEEQALAASAKINDEYLLFLVKEVRRLAKLLAKPQVPTTFVEAMELATSQAKQILVMEEKQIALTEKLTKYKSKAEYVDHIATLDDSLSITDWICIMGNQLKVPIMPRKEAIAWLREKGYICKSKMRPCSSSSKPGNEWRFESNYNGGMLITMAGQVDLWSKMLNDLRG